MSVRAILGDAALLYAARGVPVFPCAVRGKAPITTHGFHDATSDVTQIEQWWSRWPAANIGTPTGVRFDVVDFDELDAFRTVELERGCPGPLAATGRGMHWYVAPTGVGTRKLAGKIDYKAAGGYVILPPSVHPTGARYRWMRRAEPEPAPAWLLEQLAERTAGTTGAPRDEKSIRSNLGSGLSRRGVASLRAMHDRLAGAQAGNRNALLYWCTVRARDTGVDRDDVEVVLTDAARAAGLADREITRTIQSAFREWP